MTLPQFTSGLGGALSEMVLAGRHLTAQEMTGAGLVTQTFFPGRLMEEVIPRVKRATSQHNSGLQWNKLLLKQHQKSQVTSQASLGPLLILFGAGGAGDQWGDRDTATDVELQAVPRQSCQLHQYGKVPSVSKSIITQCLTPH